MAVSIVSPREDAQARTRVLRSDPAVWPPWELWQRRPPVPLAGLVAGLWAGVEPEASARHRVLPNGELMLMLHLGSTQRLTERGGAPCDERLSPVFLAGLQERPATYACRASRTRVAAVRLRPLGAWRLLGGVPQCEIAGRVLDVEDVLGRGAGTEALCARMAEAPDLGAALDLLETWLLRRLEAAPTPHPAVRAASGILERDAAGVRVAALARETGMSARRLHELFRREMGVPVKRLARILRFRRVLDALATAPAVDLAVLAQDSGYSDQSHLYRDFRDLAGMTPQGYRTAHGDGLDGPDVLGSG